MHAPDMRSIHLSIFVCVFARGKHGAGPPDIRPRVPSTASSTGHTTGVGPYRLPVRAGTMALRFRASTSARRCRWAGALPGAGTVAGDDATPLVITGTDSRISAIAGTLAYASTIAGAACQAKSMDLLNLVDEH